MDLPRTRASLAADLAALGVRPGSTLMLHSSLKSLGWVCGGAVTVVQALRDALGPDGTLVVPTHTSSNSDPAGWQHPPVPEQWWPIIRDTMPGFDPVVTPGEWMGAIAEVVRTQPDAQRSDHPHVSFAAVGRLAAEIVYGHPLTPQLGADSPLGRVYGLDGEILLLGVGHDSNTSLHLAECRQDPPPMARFGAAVRTADGGREWAWFDDVDIKEDDFEKVGADFEATGAAKLGKVGEADARLMSQRALVDYATDWFRQHRPGSLT